MYASTAVNNDSACITQTKVNHGSIRLTFYILKDCSKFFMYIGGLQFGEREIGCKTRIIKECIVHVAAELEHATKISPRLGNSRYFCMLRL